MGKHFEFTGETKMINGTTLHKIRATKTFTLPCGVTVHSGEKGGWIEKKENLADNAWVFEDAMISGDASVTGNARVAGNAFVTENASVSDDASVTGTAFVAGNAFVSRTATITGTAFVIGNASVTGNARVAGGALVDDDAFVTGNALISDNARLYGDAWVSCNEHLVQIGLIGNRKATVTFFRNKAGIIKVACDGFKGTIDKFRENVQKKHGDSKLAKVYLAAADLAELHIDVSPVEGEKKMKTENDLKQALAENIRNYLKREGVTQKDLAEMSGVSENSIGFYIRGKSVPSLYYAYLLSDVMGITIDAMMKPRKKENEK